MREETDEEVVVIRECGVHVRVLRKNYNHAVMVYRVYNKYFYKSNYRIGCGGIILVLVIMEDG